ncbi:methylated-DNA--[protein]-cysteine S-methyltransferase [Rhodoluna limnophila]|uniref:methylated-DNA--[protein]-cysteine S-methyltransferase n=1 Tax=Rhodoluna limnophila TaxID=232537 RepID=UPI001106719C|nr:methylated-DNA--[protein]-cysteine S-methyltransferase [Rhodoluna limnophila]
MTNIIFDASLSFNSPLGVISIYSLNEKVVRLRIGGEPAPANGRSSTLRKAERQISRYLSGKSKTLDFEVATLGTPFQEAVWRALESIEFGRTLSYGQIAQLCGNPKAVRAVGGAVAANPVPLRIPCHRVLGSTGQVTGYTPGLGIQTKLALLKLEGVSSHTSFERLDSIQT